RAENRERRDGVGARDREAPRARRRAAAHAIGIRLHAEAFGRAPKKRLVVPVAAGVKTDVPADRAHVPKLRRAYDLRGFGQRRRSLANPGVLGDRGERRAGADVEMTVALDARGVTNPRERDEQL